MPLVIDPNLPTADLALIQRMIPHRYPFLFLDKVVNLDAGKGAVGIKNVTINEPHFQGHFPAKPIMPGVTIVEAMAQTAAVVVTHTLDLVDKELLVYFLTLDETRFRNMVVPGDVLELHVTVIRGRGKIWKFKGEAKVGDKLCAEAVFSAMWELQQDAAGSNDGDA
jgi:3-hydroxyacyl-[acyl-carrier-protein] dehydratase